MKYCLSNRQPSRVLSEADEIKISPFDFAALPNYMSEFPDKTIILSINEVNFDFIDWDKVNSSPNIITAVTQTKFIGPANRFYFDLPCYSWNEFHNMLSYSPEYILLAGELGFSVAEAKAQLNKTNTKLRVIPNKILKVTQIPLQTPHNSSCFWIRPEDVKTYEPYVTTFELHHSDLAKERTYFKIYTQQQEWNGNLNFLIEGLDENIDNRAIPEDFGTNRLNCRQRCKMNGLCNFCDTAFKFSSNMRELHYERN